MAKTVAYHNPDMEDGIIFDVGGIAIPNGDSVDLEEEAELHFIAKKQMSVSDFFADDQLVKVSGKSELSKAQMEAHSGTKVSEEPAVQEDPEQVDVPIAETEDDS